MERKSMDFNSFLTTPENTIIEALVKIDNNKKGFLLVVDGMKRLIGILTDGDIRRALIKGVQISDCIDMTYNRGFLKVYTSDSFGKVIELFKNERIKFLPIVEPDNRLINVITKSNMHALLLKDNKVDLRYNFLTVEDDVLEHEIFNRPWGFYKTTLLNPYSQSKIIHVYPLGELSLQEHKRREEYWVIINGTGVVTIGESKKNVESGSFIYIPKGCKHKLANTSSSTSLLIAEVQLGDYFGEDDIIRYHDIYGRD
jgi:mannose-1-phosphate guanylyltransferase/mannose-6-phosphate isomerase